MRGGEECQKVSQRQTESHLVEAVWSKANAAWEHAKRNLRWNWILRLLGYLFFFPKRSTNKTVSRTTLLFSLSLLFCKTQLHFQVLSISCNIDRINTHHFVWLYTCIHPPTVQAPKTNSNVSYCIFLRQKNLVCSDEKLDTNWISCQDKWL